MFKIYIIIFNLIIICLFSYCNSIDDIIVNTFYFDKWDEAKVQLESYLKENPTDPKGLSAYAAVLNNLKLYDLAIASMKNAINYETSDEKKSGYYFNLGEYYFAKKTIDTAIEMFNKSISLNITLDKPYYMLGQIYYNKKDIDKSFDNWKKYINFTTDNDKKKKLQMIMDRYENDRAEQERLLAEKKLKEEEELKRLEEEKRRKEEILKKLMEELQGDQTDSKSLDEKKIKDEKVKPELEDIK